jgi:sugar lactone lactonase YvrE
VGFVRGKLHVFTLLLLCVCTGCGLTALGGTLLALTLSGKSNNSNQIPSPVSVITPSTTVFDRVQVAYTLADPGQKAFDVKVEYSTTGELGPFLVATEALGAPSQGLARLSASAAGNPHVFVWNSFADLQPQGIVENKSVVVRVTAISAGQGQSYGNPGLSQAFSVDNRLIATVAGSPSTEGEGLPANQVPLVAPAAAIVGSGGATIVADTGNAKVRYGDPTSNLVTTLAGSSTAGNGGDLGPAVAAQFLTPSGIALDLQGNLLISDTGNNRLRRVDAVTQVVNTIAGIGTAGFTGDNGAASAAELSAPTAVVVDGSGNIFFCDTGNSVIREITGTTIRTVAGTGTAGASGDGGPATSAQLNRPTGLCVAASGGVIFVADAGNHAVRRFTVGGSLTTVAGMLGMKGLGGEKLPPATAQLSSPGGVALQGNALVIADTGNNRLRRFELDPATLAPAAQASIVTIAGAIDGTAGFAGDNGPALAALLSAPLGLSPDGQGGILVADAGNNRVRKLDANGLITTLMGSGTASATSVGDGGPATQATLANGSQFALAADGSIVFVEIDTARVRAFKIGGTITTIAGNGISGYSGDNGPATQASLNQPFGLAIDSNGIIFIGDTSNAVVRAVNPVDGTITTFAGGGTGPDGVATATSFSCPAYLCALPGQNQLLVEDAGNEVIRRVSYGFDAATGNPTNATTDVVCGTYASFPGGFGGEGGPATSAQLACPAGIDVDSNGRVYIVDQFGACVRRFTIGGKINVVCGDPTTPAASNGENVPALSTTIQACRLAIDRGSNTIYFEELSSTTSRLRAFTDGGNIATVAGQNTTIADITPGAPALTSPLPVLLGVFALPDGSVLAASGGTRRILQFKPGGAINAVAGVAPGANNGDGGPAIAATIHTPIASIGADETLYIGESSFGDVRRVDPKTGRISTAVGIGIRGLAGVGGPLAQARIDRIDGFNVDPNTGNVIIPQRNEQLVVQADFRQQKLLLVAGTGLPGTAPFGDGGPATQAQVASPGDAFVGPKTKNLYIVDTGDVRIRQIDSSGRITTVAGGGASTQDGAPATGTDLTDVTTMTVDQNEVIYVVLTSPTDSLVRKFTVGGNMTTVAGVPGSSGFNGDNIPATQALLNQPNGVAVDKLGNVYISDQFNHRVRRVDTAGFIATVAGTGVAGSGPDGVPAQLSKLNGPKHIVIDRFGNLWVAEGFGNRVRRFRTFP